MSVLASRAGNNRKMKLFRRWRRLTWRSTPVTVFSAQEQTVAASWATSWREHEEKSCDSHKRPGCRFQERAYREGVLAYWQQTCRWKLSITLANVSTNGCIVCETTHSVRRADDSDYWTDQQRGKSDCRRFIRIESYVASHRGIKYNSGDV